MADLNVIVCHFKFKLLVFCARDAALESESERSRPEKTLDREIRTVCGAARVVFPVTSINARTIIIIIIISAARATNQRIHFLPICNSMAFQMVFILCFMPVFASNLHAINYMTINIRWHHSHDRRASTSSAAIRLYADTSGFFAVANHFHIYVGWFVSSSSLHHYHYYIHY